MTQQFLSQELLSQEVPVQVHSRVYKEAHSTVFEPATVEDINQRPREGQLRKLWSLHHCGLLHSY